MRSLLWRLTDPEYRRRFNDNRRRVNKLRAAQSEVGRLIVKAHGSKVICGPFTGACYHGSLGGIIPTQKLLGTYEKELWPIIDNVCARDYLLVVDIGAAEGYYVAGLATRLKRSRVIAFEAQTHLHTAIRSLAVLNGVADRVDVRGLCDAQSLQCTLSAQDRVLVICDIEGAEKHVLNPSAVPQLRTCDILVEVHEHLASGVSDELRQRFRETHMIDEVASVPRTMADWPIDLKVDHELAQLAMDESRNPMNKWFWMAARNAACEAGNLA